LTLQVNADFTTIGIYNNKYDKNIVAAIPYGDYTDDTDTPFASYQDLIDYLDPFFFRVNSGGGGSGTGWQGEVDTFNDLPPAGDHTGEVYLVKNKQGSQLTFNLKRSGFYQSDGATWTKLSQVQFMFTDDELTFKDDADNTKQLGFELNLLSTATRRTVTFPDTDITLDDQNDPRPPLVHASTHEEGGSDEIEGAAIKTTYTPTNYTPTATDLEGQLDGIDNELGDKVESVQAGSGISVDNSDPQNPIVSTNTVPSGVSQDYVRATNSVSQPLNVTGDTDITYDTQDKNSNATVYTVGSNVITVNETGRYRVKSEVSIKSVGTQRADPTIKMLVNGVEVQDTLARSIKGYGLYARNSGLIEDSSCIWDYTLDLTAGDTLQTRLTRNNIDLNSVSTIPDGTYLEVTRLETSSGGGQSASESLYFCMMGQASSASGYLSKGASSNANPSGLFATSTPFNQFVNGNVDPYKIGTNGIVEEISLTIAAGAVSTGTVDPDVKIRMSVYRVDGTSETNLGDVDLPLDDTKIGVFNNLGGTTNTQATTVTGLSIAVSDGDMIGLRFSSITGDNEFLSSISRIQAVALIM